MIAGSDEIGRVLEDMSVDDVADYHKYPVADNDSPKLSGDRLEYTLGNLVNFGRRSEKQVRAYLNDLKVCINRESVPELAFQHADTAIDFAYGALEMGKIYVSEEDRFAMEMLAKLLKEAVESRVIAMEDLWLTEGKVIEKLNRDQGFRDRWNRFRGYYQVSRGTGTVIHAKKRYIDPLVENEGRVTEIRGDFRTAVDAFLAESQDEPLSGLSHAAAL